MLVGNAHIAEGDASSVPSILALLEKEGVRPHGNPDVYIRTYAHFGVDDAREIRERAILRGSEGQRVFVLVAPGMTNEAQNALLKTLEEAPGDALFILVVPAPNMLLPTVRSRAQILVLDGAGGESVVDVRAFLAASPQERLDALKPLLEKGDDERRDMGAVLIFLSSLEHMLESAPREHIALALDAVYRARRYAGDRGALLKPLLEQVALLVPVTKA